MSRVVAANRWRTSTLRALLILSTLIFVSPVLWVVLMSFRPTPALMSGLRSITSTDVTLENYQTLFNEYEIFRFIGNSLIGAAIPAVIAVFVALLAGYSLVRFRIRATPVFQSMPLFAQVVPAILIVIPLYSVFLFLGLLDLAMTAAIWRWLPTERRAKRAEPSTEMLGAALGHLRNGALRARYAIGFCVLFSLVSTFTYVTFYLAAPPFRLSPALLGLIFVVYLAGAAVTPLAGRWLDRLGSQRTIMGASLLGIGGVLLTTEPRLWAVALGLAICCTGVFIAQAAISSSLGHCTKQHRALAVGLYVTCYYLGGSAGATLPAWAWNMGGWPACVGLIVLAQAVTFGIARWFWFLPAA
jgi:hypothetical protein